MNNISESRIEVCKRSLGLNQTVPVILEGKEYRVEYLFIPAETLEGQRKTPIFNYPGGLTDLFPCIEPLLFLDRRSFVISPLGYGNSSDIPDRVFQKEPLHGANVALQVLKALGIEKVVLYAHSNGAPIIAEMAIRSREYDIEVEKMIFINPLGLRDLPWFWPILAFPLFGVLSRIFSLGSKHPLTRLKGSYKAPKHPRSLSKIGYEVKKSAIGRLPSMLREIERRGLKIPISVIQSRWDWASLHLSGRKSNEQIFQENVPAALLRYVDIAGLHNVTLGKDSGNLADTLEQSLLALAIFIPQLAVRISWLAFGLGIV